MAAAKNPVIAVAMLELLPLDADLLGPWLGACAPIYSWITYKRAGIYVPKNTCQILILKSLN